MEDAIAAAARANVNIFTVDPRGLVGLTSEYIELNQSNADCSTSARAIRAPACSRRRRCWPKCASRRTASGRFPKRPAGLRRSMPIRLSTAFNRIVEANSLYYMLGYYPPNHPRTGSSTRLKCASIVPALRVMARRGYASPRARTLTNRERERVERERIARTKGADQTSSELRAMLDSPIQQSGVGARGAGGRRSRARRATPRSRLAIEIDAAASAVRAAERQRRLRQRRSSCRCSASTRRENRCRDENGARSHASARDARAREAARPARQPAPRAAARTLSAARRRPGERRRRNGHRVLRSRRSGFHTRAVEHERAPAERARPRNRPSPCSPTRLPPSCCRARRRAAAPSRGPMWCRLYAEIYENASSGPPRRDRCHDAADRRSRARTLSVAHEVLERRRSRLDERQINHVRGVEARTAAEGCPARAAICCA